VRGFVLVNPLHAAEPIPPMEPSPYLPVTRRFVNPVYLRVEDIPEYSYLTGAALEEIERIGLLQRITNESRDQLDRDAVWGAKRTALAMIHAVPRAAGREANYQAFLAREGEGLVDFATWCALAERHGLAWDEWPEELQDPRSPSVEKARAELAERVDFFCWLQWVVDEQLGGAQRAATEAGMPLGIVHDLAVGVHPVGADTWALQDVLARGVNVGAPADAFNQQGQDWSQPPWRPDALAELAYGPYRDMVRTILRHAGGIRVDHVIGLFRLWWVPQGSAPSAGTYVRYDHEALVGILALEAYRSGALVVGEDLGTVEPWVRDYLADRGILGHVDPVVREGPRQRAHPASRGVARAVPRHGHDARPAADGGLPGRRAHPHPPRARAADPPGRGGTAASMPRTGWRGCGILREVGLLEESGGKPGRGGRGPRPARLPRPHAVPAGRRGAPRRRRRPPCDEPAGHQPRVPELVAAAGRRLGTTGAAGGVVASERAQALAAMVDQRRRATMQGEPRVVTGRPSRPVRCAPCRLVPFLPPPGRWTSGRGPVRRPLARPRVRLTGRGARSARRRDGAAARRRRRGSVVAPRRSATTVTSPTRRCRSARRCSSSGGAAAAVPAHRRAGLRTVDRPRAALPPRPGVVRLAGVVQRTRAPRGCRVSGRDDPCRRRRKCPLVTRSPSVSATTSSVPCDTPRPRLTSRCRSTSARSRARRGPRAERLHAALDAPESSVLVAVDPAARSLEIVNGEGLRHRLDDRACGLAALAMTTAFAAGDLSGGIVNGVQSLAEHARAPRTLHLDTP
jgi:hypothetical protein